MSHRKSMALSSMGRFHDACAPNKCYQNALELLRGYDDAAIGFGCHPETMRQHYVALDEQRISDDVMSRI